MKTLAVCLLMGLLGAVFAMDRVAAQIAPASGTQLITLGTAGGPLPRADRAQSSNLLVVNGALYLIDAGGGVTSRVVQSGHDFRKIGKIFITHPQWRARWHRECAGTGEAVRRFLEGLTPQDFGDLYVGQITTTSG